MHTIVMKTSLDVEVTVCCNRSCVMNGDTMDWSYRTVGLLMISIIRVLMKQNRMQPMLEQKPLLQVQTGNADRRSRIWCRQ